MKASHLIIAISVMTSLSAAALHATTIGHWRFENPDNIGFDSSGNNLHLINQPVSAEISQYELNSTGPGSSFFNPIPNTGAGNSFALSLSGTSHLAIADRAVLAVESFTIEAMVHMNSTSASSQYIASQWGAGPNDQRSWGFGVAGTGNASELLLLISPLGATTNAIYSGVSIEAGKDYYLAASFDLNNKEDGITFYINNLTDGTSEVKTFSHDFETIHNSTAPFEIGASSYTNRWNGLIDEVRFSDGVLSPDQLLANIPEPSTYAAMFGLGSLLLVMFSKRKSSRNSQ